MKRKTFIISLCVALSIAFAAFCNFHADSCDTDNYRLTSQEIEACTSCEVTASAHKMGIKIAEASLECKGLGTCMIPTNEFGLTASCSGKMVKYDLSVLGKKVN